MNTREVRREVREGTVARGLGAPPGRNGLAVTALILGVVGLAIMVSVLVAVLMVWYANHTQACYRPDSFHQYTQCVREHLTGSN